MDNQGKLGIGNLQNLQKTSDEDSSSNDDVPAGTEESSVSEEPQATQEPQEDGPLGEEAGTMVYDQSPETSGHQEVEIKCHATDCIFNRQHNCHAQQVEIDMSAAKGQVPSATSCKTYQPASTNENSSAGD